MKIYIEFNNEKIQNYVGASAIDVYPNDCVNIEFPDNDPSIILHLNAIKCITIEE